MKTKYSWGTLQVLGPDLDTIDIKEVLSDVMFIWDEKKQAGIVFTFVDKTISGDTGSPVVHKNKMFVTPA